MEAKDEHQYRQIIQRKPTKRRTSSSPLALTMATTSSCSTATSDVGFIGASDVSDSLIDRLNALPQPISNEYANEEEDMANCLILLAKGQSRRQPTQLPPQPTVASTSSKTAEVYRCKTCNRCFPSFQALGGHRASHKKPKPTTLEEDQHQQLNYDQNTILSLQISSRNSNYSQKNKSRVHECSMCGAEFNSGQALGGHMRRHRTMPAAAVEPGSHEDSKKTKNVLSLDLNLPAPEPEEEEEDLQEPKFPFASKEIIVFSASPLVHCHY